MFQQKNNLRLPAKTIQKWFEDNKMEAVELAKSKPSSQSDREFMVGFEKGPLIHTQPDGC